MTDRAGSASELVPLAERVQRMQLFRLAVSALVVMFGLLAPEVLGAGLGELALGLGTYVVLSLACEWAWQRFRGGLVLFGAMLIADGVFLAWLSYATGGLVSPLRYLILLHLIAVSLLASHRTGLKLALWHSLLLFVVFYAQEAEILRPFSRSVEELAGSNFQQLVAFVVLFWLVAMITGTLSAVNERELRRRRYDLEALARMAVRLEDATDPSAAAQVLLDSVADAFDAERAVVLGGQGDELSVMAARGTALPASPHLRPGRQSTLHHVRESRQTQLVSELDPEHDSWLASLFPSARNLAVLPLTAEGRSVGVLVIEHALREGSRIERRVVSILERFASQGSLALRNAWLLEQLQKVASTDGLTGIANRRAFDMVLERELARAARNGAPVSLVMLDIDNFKELNDNHGHQRGDDVLRAVAAALAKECREYDTAARYGGEEFAMILPNCTAAEAPAAAERLRVAVAEAGSPVRVTASGGVATFPMNGRDAASVVTAADEALYESKRAGRNRVTASTRQPLRLAPQPVLQPSELSRTPQTG
jgi:diguanylate cyclase (GGDEF)-like protein